MFVREYCRNTNVLPLVYRYIVYEANKKGPYTFTPKKKPPISMEVVGLETGSFDLTDRKKSKQIDYL
jgi:hypothetical protein